MNHRITVCISCRRKGTETRLGFELIERLRNALLAAEEMIPETFDVSGVACMAGCDRPCTVAYHSTSKASYLFGDIDPKTDVDDLIAFAKQYAYLGDGWCSSVDRPGKLRKSTLARIPAAGSALEEQKARAS
ncbi:DUF1636 family protein [Roseibium alexandrii]|uniref:Putative metal-binding protein n=1 Tax=Roseibium alexandrii TaxID=388408 RepID=A0A0M6ZRR9_9HYPH|nr:DUF1636 domain-containing protein [Roseibium alexandrii]CTQ65455.1 putative metal-binding protein [Roseibium alexandrii]